MLAGLTVILVHGLWMPGLVMQPLAHRLARQGARTVLFSYPGRRRSLEDHGQRLSRLARQLAGDAPVFFVGHSLGGLVVLEALSRADAPEPGAVVLMGTPARGCLAARRFAHWPGGRALLGASRPLWEAGRQARWDRSAPLGVIAGSRPLGLGRALGRLPGRNDGVVCVEETTVQGMRERIVLPVGHSGMLVSPRVAREVTLFLAQGRFSTGSEATAGAGGRDGG